MLAKNSPIPLYYQLAEQIREWIQSGQLQIGDRLMPERELAQQAGVSRMTARQAVAYLVRDGFLEVKPGVGTFVAEPKLSYDAVHLLGFTEAVTQSGGVPSSQVLQQAIALPPPHVARALHIPAKELIVKIVRLRAADQVPVLLETNYIPHVLCPGLENEDLVNHSLYRILEDIYGVRAARASQTFGATIANDYERTAFGLPTRMAMFLQEGVTYMEDDRPLEYFKAVYRSDRCAFMLESRRNDQNADAPITRVSLRMS